MSSETKLTILCGDPTCDNYGCSQEAIDAWNSARKADARAIVRHALGLPSAGVDTASADTDDPTRKGDR